MSGGSGTGENALTQRFSRPGRPSRLPASLHGSLGRLAALDARVRHVAARARPRPGPQRRQTRAQSAARRGPRRARAGRHLLRDGDEPEVELERGHPLGGVVARPRRRRAGLEGRVDLLLAERSGEGRGGVARAAAHGAGSARGARTRAGRRDRRSPGSDRAAGESSAAGRGRVEPDVHGREPHRPRAARDDVPQRPRRIPAARRRGRMDQHLAHEDRAVRRPPGAGAANGRSVDRWRSRRDCAPA